MQFSKKSFKFQFEIIIDSVAGNSMQKAAKHGETQQCTVGKLLHCYCT